MRRVNPEIYTKKYYANHSKGFDNMVEKLSPYISGLKNLKILDLGCGSGDLTIYLAKQGNTVVGVDYSKHAIDLARKKTRHLPEILKKRMVFSNIDAKNINYGKNTFDMVVLIDFFEHVYDWELRIIMKNISVLLKPEGKLLVHTEANKLYLDILHGLYVYPMDSFLIKINRLLTKKDYPGLPKEPRNELHKIQHVNEPTYFYLKKLFGEFGFSGEIECKTLVKPIISWKDQIYNVFVMLDPLSRYFPLKYYFAYDFICNMRKRPADNMESNL